MTTRRFEMVEGGSAKFWEITESGTSFTVRYGRIGTNGQTQTKEFASAEKASAAATKLIAEKTGKGYVETGAPATASTASDAADVTPVQTEASTPDTAAAAPKTAKPKPDKKERAPKAEAKQLPPLVLSGDKPIGARALANAAERLSSATTKEAWNEAVGKLPGATEWERSRAFVYLMEHELFAPNSRLQMATVAHFLFASPVDVILRVLPTIEDAWVQTLPTEGPIFTAFVPVLAEAQRLAPDRFRTTTLAPTLAGIACLVRAIAGEDLASDESTRAMETASALLAYGHQSIVIGRDQHRPLVVDPDVLAAAFARIAGPHWIRSFPHSERLPAKTAIAGLADESLEEAARAVSMFNKELLVARNEPPARFFEVAATLEPQKAQYLRLAGIAHAKSPDEIPAGGEDAIAPRDVLYERGFARLGTARLDAWAARWLDEHPTALTANDPNDPATSSGIEIRRLAVTALPFGDAMRERILGEPLPYLHVPENIDVGAYIREVTNITAEAAPAVLRVAAAKARAAEARGARPEIVQGIRLVVDAAVRAMPPDAPIDESIDALITLGDAVDYDRKRIVREAVLRLPVERAERVVARSANELADPYEEITYARGGASPAAMRRFARLVAGGRQNETMWLHARNRALAPLGAAFGPALVESLAGEALSESFFSRLAGSVHEDAMTHLRAALGKDVLDLAAEMKKLADEIGGDRIPVYVMNPAAPGRGRARIGGLPAGFTAEDIPRHHGRKMLHAFTVDLSAVPELAARYPGASTLSVFIQAYTEAVRRGQALVPRTEAQITANPATSDAPALSLERVEVPAAAFASNPPERAKYARQLLYRKPGFLLGGPIWLQDGPWGVDPRFVAQYDERLAIGANFGDFGLCYSFDDRAEWQSH